MKTFVVSLLALAGVAGFNSPDARAAQTATLSVLANFGGDVPPDEEGNGMPPVTAPVKAKDGNYYGIAPIGGTYGNGFVFKITPAGAYSVFHNFHDDELSSPLIEEGDQPRVLIAGTDGNLYGICNDGGLNDDEVNHNGGGTIFKITLTGTYTKLHDFDKGDPNTAPVQPVALLEGSAGNFYGLTNLGGKGTDSNGVFFKFVASTKTFTELLDFTPASIVGFQPEAQLILAKDGYFYGTTTDGGGTDTSEEAFGTIFKINTAGQATLLHVFQPDTDDPSVVVPQPDSTPLVQGTDGYLYGASTVGGNEDGDGAIYRCSTAGAFALLHVFADGADGANPSGGLVEGADGTFYGGLQGGFGTAIQPAGGYFQIRAGGAYTVLYKFNSSSSTGPVMAASKLVEISKGIFYGETAGGTNGIGTLAKVIVTPAITSALTATATVGAAFSYEIFASNGPTSYGFQGTANGLSINGTTGVISGKPTAAGTYKYTLVARNAAGAGTATLTLTVKAASTVPVVTSAKTASGTTGKAFSYQITATNSPTAFGFQGTANGLAINAKTGVISGIPQVAGTYTYTLNAANASGKGSETLTVTIANAPPVIESAKTAAGKVGVAFSYQIRATGSPTGYGFQGTGNGLGINSTTGLITGKPAGAGTFTYTLNAYNSLGKGSETLTVTVSK